MHANECFELQDNDSNSQNIRVVQPDYRLTQIPTDERKVGLPPHRQSKIGANKDDNVDQQNRIYTSQKTTHNEKTAFFDDTTE